MYHSPACDEFLNALPHEGDFVFPGGIRHSNLKYGDGGIAETNGADRHNGPRLPFDVRDWAAETTAYPNHVIEMALAHAIGDKVEAAYRRGDLFAKRSRLMAEWAKYCSQLDKGQTGVVTAIRARA